MDLLIHGLVRDRLVGMETEITESLVSEIRNQFVAVDSDSISCKRIYFENGGGSLKLKSIFEVIESFTAIPDNAGRGNMASKRITEVISRGRQDIALFLGAKTGSIIAGESTTGLLFRIKETIARNVKGGNMITSNLAHASNYDSTRIVAERHGLEFRVARLRPETGIVPVESFLEHVDEQTVSMTVIHTAGLKLGLIVFVGH